MVEIIERLHIVVLHHPGKANMFANALGCMTMGSVSHVEEDKKDLVRMFIGCPDWVLDWKIL